MTVRRRENPAGSLAKIWDGQSPPDIYNSRQRSKQSYHKNMITKENLLQCMKCMLKMLVPIRVLAIVPRASYSQPGSGTKVCRAPFWNKSQKSTKSHQPQDQHNWWTSLIQITSTI